MRFGKVVNEITICGCIRVPSWWSFKRIIAIGNLAVGEFVNHNFNDSAGLWSVPVV